MEPEPVEEIWIFAGSRVGKGNKRVHAWVPIAALSDPDPVLLFKAHGTYAVGSEYRVQVTRNGDRITRHGKPEYFGRHDDETVRGQLQAAHKAAEYRLRLAARERDDKRDLAYGDSLDRLRDVSRGLRPYDREIFALHVFQRIMNP